MGSVQSVTGTINGSPIVGTRLGPQTGDLQFVTANGRVWNVLNGVVPNTLSTGGMIATVQK